MSVDKYFDHSYHPLRYNCLHFTRDVWLDLTGVDIKERLEGLFDPRDRHPNRKHLRSFKHLQEPVDPCIILMQWDRKEPHIGIFIYGKILHLTEFGVHYQPLEIAGLGFNSFRYYL